MKKATPVLLLGGLALAACLQAHAAEPQATQPEATADAGNALMVGIDARTGKLRPLTAAQARALSAKAAAMPRGHNAFATVPRTDAQVRATVRHHGNAMSMRVPTSAMSAVVATRRADGSLQVTETDGSDQPSAPRSQEVTE
jgi:hypothetical protein